jgi:trimeric autotransporter adhesin
MACKIQNYNDVEKSSQFNLLVAPIIEAIKSIFDRLTHVERGVSSLQTENEKLKNENAELKKYLCSKDPSEPFCN